MLVGTTRGPLSRADNGQATGKVDDFHRFDPSGSGPGGAGQLAFLEEITIMMTYLRVRSACQAINLSFDFAAKS